MGLGQNWLNNWLGFAVESLCPLCQRSTARVFCPDCELQVWECQVSSDPCQPQPTRAGKPLILAWGQYQGGLKRAIAALKYQNHPEIARPLGEWLAQTWQQSRQTARFTVVPIPMHVSKRKTRGFNQAELIARRFCDVTGLPLAAHGLERIQATQAQFQAGSASNRLQNLAGAFRVGAVFQKKRPCHPVLLIDDIYTTGATIQSATISLQKQGIPVAGVAVVARAKLDRGG